MVLRYNKREIHTTTRVAGWSYVVGAWRLYVLYSTVIDFRIPGGGYCQLRSWKLYVCPVRGSAVGDKSRLSAGSRE